MRSNPISVFAACAVCALLTVDPDFVPGARAREIARVQSQLDVALADMARADLGSLTAAQRDRRATLTRILRGYRDRGRFPVNYDFAEPTPYFVDRKTGVLCAVGFLLESSGRRDIVDRVAAANNNVWVQQLRDDAEFNAWLRQSGLTLDEAALIQEPYTISPPVSLEASRLDERNRVGTLASSFFTLATLSDKPATHGRVWNSVGLGIGVFSIAEGIKAVGTRGTDQQVARASLATGGASILMSIIRLRDGASGAKHSPPPRLGIAPTVAPESKAAGLSVSMRF